MFATQVEQMHQFSLTQSRQDQLYLSLNVQMIRTTQLCIPGLKITAGQRSLTAESDSLTFEIAVSPIMLTVVDCVEVLSGYFLLCSIFWRNTLKSNMNLWRKQPAVSAWHTNLRFMRFTERVYHFQYKYIKSIVDIFFIDFVLCIFFF